MALFRTSIRRDTVSLLRFLFLSHIHVFSREMLHISRLKRPFIFYFCLLVITVLLFFQLSVMFLVAVISLPPCFSMLSSCRCIDASALSSRLAIPLPPFLDTYSPSTSFLGCNALGMVINFLVFWSICLSCSVVHFKNDPEYLTNILLLSLLFTLWAFHISVSRWFFTGVWVTASLLKFPGLFFVFWPFSTMLSFGWSPLVRQLPSPLVPLVIL